MSELDSPVMPVETGDAFRDSRARHEHFVKLTAYLEKQGPAAAATAAPSPVYEGDNLAAFDAEMRTRGFQRSDTAAQAIEARVAQIEREHPGHNATTAQKAAWEQRVGAALTELQSAQASAGPVAASTTQPADIAEAVVPAAVPAEALHGYVMPTDLGDVYVDLASLSANLAAAKAAGISQGQVDAVMRELAKGAV